MKLFRAAQIAFTTLSLAAASLPAWSAPCGGTYPVLEPLNTTDVTLSGSPSDACYGVIGGNVNNQVDANTALAGYVPIGSGWASNFLKSDSNLTTAWNGLNFTLSVNGAGTTVGDFILTATDADPLNPLNLPTNIDILVALKAGNQWAAYFFDEEGVTVNPSTGTWAVKFDNNPQIQNFAALSHLSVFFRESSTPFCTNPGACPRNNVPEPSPLALLGLLLLAPLFMRRRAR